MKKYIVYFTDGTNLDFEAMCDIGAREYSEYRAAQRGTSVNYLHDENSRRIK